MRTFILWLLSSCLLMPAVAQTKRAFIVGVEDYEQITPLTKTLEDANGYAVVFEQDLGFEVTKLLNPDYFEFSDALAKFTDSIEENDEVAFIFSGHGWSDGASNFLVMRDAPLVTTTEVLKGRTFDLNLRVLKGMRAKKPGLVFAIVDACRVNPFDLGTRSFSRGMAPQQTIPGSLVVYAAGANEAALDRLGPDDASDYSVFTRTFLPKLKDPTAPLMRSINDAREETMEIAGQIQHSQRPAIYSDISLDYCFAENCPDPVSVLKDSQALFAGIVVNAIAETASSIFERESGDHTESLLMALQIAPQLWSANSEDLGSSADAVQRAADQIVLSATSNLLIGDLQGHASTIVSSALSSDGNHLATGDYGGQVYVWDLESKLPIKIIDAHTDPVRCVSLSDNGNMLATGCSDSSVIIWDVATGSAIQEIETDSSSERSIELSDNGTLLLTRSIGGPAELWDVGSGRTLRKFGRRTVAAALSGDGSVIATGSYDGAVRIWSAESGEAISFVSSLRNLPVTDLELSDEGTVLVIAQENQPVRVFDVETKSETAQLIGHTDRDLNVAINADATRIATASRDRVVIWGVENGSDYGVPIETISKSSNSYVPIEISKDGELLISASSRTVSIWDIEVGPTRVINGSDKAVNSIALSSDGAKLAIASQDENLRIWDAESGALLNTLAGHTASFTSVDFSRDGTRVAVGSTDNSAAIWDIESGARLTTFLGHSGKVFAVALSPDGAQLATASEDNTAILWDTDSGRAIFTLSGHAAQITSVTWSSAGDFLITGADDNSAKSWNASTGEMVVNFAGHPAPVRSVALSPKGNLLATGSSDGTIKLWETASGELLRTIEVNQSVSNVDFLGTSNRLVAGTVSSKSTVEVWNADTGEKLHGFIVPHGYLFAMAVAEGKRYLATGSHTGIAALWTLPKYLDFSPDEMAHEACLLLSRAKQPLSINGVDVLDHPILWIDPLNQGKLRIDPSLPIEQVKLESPCRDYLPDATFN
jgi:WD40 repeat protein